MTAPDRVASVPSGGAVGSDLGDAVIELGRLALVFGQIDRTACYKLDGTRESDTDHSVMLGWIAPALASLLFGELDSGLIAQFALVHDMVEVYAGDTPTLRIDAAGRAAKAEREAAAARRLVGQFARALPWVAATLVAYERQAIPEARFVRALDKLMPRIVHLLNGGRGLHELGFTAAELAEHFARQQADIERYAGEFTALMELSIELVDRTVALIGSQEERSG